MPVLTNKILKAAYAAGNVHTRQRDPMLQIGPTLATLYRIDAENADHERLAGLLNRIDAVEHATSRHNRND